jgi:hypothetical protein
MANLLRSLGLMTATNGRPKTVTQSAPAVDVERLMWKRDVEADARRASVKRTTQTMFTIRIA